MLAWNQYHRGAPITAHTEPRHVLFVGGDRASQRLVERVVTGGVPDARVSCASDGAQALQVLERESVDLVITDLTTPVMDGGELLRHVVARQMLVPVVVLTAPGAGSGETGALAGWASECLEKPLQPESCGRCIRELLDAAARRSYLEGVSLPGFAQLLGMEGKTCTLRACIPGAQGVLFFQAGQLVDARQGERSGLAAALEVFTWKHPTITLEAPARGRPTTINLGLMELLLESARLVDERERHQRRGAPRVGLALVQEADDDILGGPEFAGWPGPADLFAEPASTRPPAAASRPAPVIVAPTEPPRGDLGVSGVALPPGVLETGDHFELIDHARDLMRVADFAAAEALLLRALELRPGDRVIQQNLRALARRRGG